MACGAGTGYPPDAADYYEVEMASGVAPANDFDYETLRRRYDCIVETRRRREAAAVADPSEESGCDGGCDGKCGCLPW